MSPRRLLLDTSILIWWLSEPERLGSVTADLIADPDNAISCSVVNLWEIQIKTQLGKLDVAMPLAAIHDWIVDQEGWALLPVRWPHIDRLLIAQAMEEQLSLVSVDMQLARYPLDVLG